MNVTSTMTGPESSAAELTASQIRIWTGQMLSPDKPLYNMAMAFRIEGKIAASKFSDAFQKVVDENDALRTIFKEHNGIPSQHIVDELHFETEFIDLSNSSSPAETTDKLLRSRAREHFNLAERLFDSALLKLGSDRFVWYINQHHLICDAWSCAVLYQRVAHYYQLAVDGKLANLDIGNPRPQFPDYQITENHVRKSAEGREAAGYWSEKFAQDRPGLEVYGRRVDSSSAATRRISCDIGQTRSEKLLALTKVSPIKSISQDLSLYYIFSALLFTYIHRVSGHNEMVIGSPSHNRSTLDHKQTLGLFVELFPLQLTINPEDTFRTLIESVIPEANSLLRNALPGASSEIPGDCYSVVLNYLNVSFADFCGMATHCSWIHSGFGDRGHALRLQVHDFDATGSFTLLFDLNEEIFPPSVREHAAGHFLNLVDALLENLDTPIDQICLLTSSETEILTKAYNDTSVALPMERSLLELIKEQVDHSPEAIAIAQGGLELSYRRLDQLSDYIAFNLNQMGIGGEDIVAVYMRRSTSLIISLLGIMKAGAAFAPIDISFPQQRIIQIVEDSSSPIILTSSDLKSTLSGIHTKILDFDEIISKRPSSSQSPADPKPIAPRSLVYAIYTSGSTGRPKGVMIEHRSLLNYLCWARKEYMSDGVHDLPLFSSVAADLTITSMFLPLISGSRVVVYPESSDGLDLSIMDVFNDDRVDIIKLTPSHLALLDGSKNLPARLKKLIVGGEDFKSGLARRVSSLYNGKITIYNEYGPTEATIGCMIYRFDPVLDTEPSVAIGRPIDNLRIYLLDTAMNPVPVGVKGDLYIGGTGLARGYHNQDGMTAEKFVADPFHPGETMYYSGDIGRWRSAGVLDYLGRKDDQVKVRGFRIELAEIEAALCQIDGISESFTRIIERTTKAIKEQKSLCKACGLPSNVPKADLDESGICAPCRNFNRQRHLAEQYFKSENDLNPILTRAKQRSAGRYDCLMQYSGGKDSTFALYKLVEMGMRPLVFSFDNGFIPESAKDNIRRIVEDLELDLHWGETPAMNEIFVDSLRRFSNVCNGCQKVINTMSVTLASEHNVEYVFTGLSRGQSFETRVADLLNMGIVDVEEIDRSVIEARKAYHQMDDAVNKHLDVSVFEDETVFERIRFIDFYRYYDVPLADVLEFLNTKTPWTRPADTGRSTNCLINEVGIHIHQKERGYHNYAAPYSWDVRLGHKQRDSALKELEDEIDEARVNRMLKEIGYDPDEKGLSSIDRRIAAYYVGERDFTPEELRSLLGRTLPAYMMPAHFLRMQSFPLNAIGKVDHRALPLPEESTQTRVTEYMAPRSGVEKTLTEIWESVLGVEQVGIHDNFFDLGGDSILNIQIVSRAVKAGIHITPALLFQSQTIAELAEAASSLQPEQGIETQFSDVLKVDTTPYPLTPLQAGMLFHTLKEPNSGVYVEQYCCTLSGSLDLETLQETWNSIIRQHQVLRTSFILDDPEQPLQKVNEQVVFEWHVEEAGEKSSDDILQHIDTYLRKDRKRGFRLDDPPLLRFAFFDLGDGSHRFIWTFHHIICDGWSSTQIIQEMVAEYQSLRQGQTIFQIPGRPYRDYVSWLQRQDLPSARRFWASELSGSSGPTPLPVYHIDPQRQGYGKYQLNFSTEFTASLNTAARSRRLTVNTIIQGAWALLLHLYSGEDDIIFGSTVSGRPPSFDESETMVGLFINTLPIRVRIAPDASFSDWLAALLIKQVKIRDYEYSSLVSIQEWSGFEPGVPLFETIVVFENVPASRPDQALPADLSVEQVEYLEQSNFPIAIIALPGQQLELAAFHDKKIFSDDHVRRLLGHLQKIIEEFVDNPDQSLRSLSLLSQQERDLLSTWHGKTRTAPERKTVHELFEEQTSLHPEKNALSCGSETLSYRELNCRVNRLAHYLVEQDIVQGSYLGIYMDRSVDMIVAMLAVLKSGSSYVPLDPDYPDHRIGYMLSDAKPSAVLTLDRLASTISDYEAPVISLDSKALRLDHYSESNRDSSAKPDDIAYIIYTSGSTGTPKGVIITHGNLSNSTHERIEYYKTPPERFLLLSSISFDSSVAGIFGTLCAGGCLHIPAQQKFRDVSYLAELIKHHSISHILAIPSLYEHLLQFHAAQISSLKSVIVAGESCGIELVEKHQSALPQAKLFNEYGPTEATVWCTVFDCSQPFASSTVPIGKPIGNTRVYVLDKWLRQIPAGVIGELYLGGAGISPGYLHQSNLTSERFIDLNLVESERQKVYKTGDLVRFLDDGSLQYLGRNDEQIKMRGFRIELGEIESVLRKLPAIKKAAVVPNRTSDRSTRRPSGTAHLNQDQIGGLVAYVTLDSNEKSSVKELKSALKVVLPDYMIPNYFIMLDSLPLHPNGKIDRARLPAPSSVAHRRSENGVLPVTELEKNVAAVWCEVLDLEKIFMFDNFFELGGHSLLLVQLASKLNKVAQKTITISDLYQVQTLKDQVQLLHELNSDKNLSSESDGTSTFFWIHGEGSNRLLSKYLDPGQRLHLIFHQSSDGKAAKFKTIEDISKYYLGEIRRIQKQGPYSLGGYCVGGVLAFEIAQILISEGEEVSILFMLDPSEPKGKSKKPDLSNGEPTATDYSLSGSRNRLRNSIESSISRRFEDIKIIFGSRALRRQLLKEGTEKIRLLFAQFGLFLGFRIPEDLRTTYILKVYEGALKNYSPQEYPGKIVLYFSGKIHSMRSYYYRVSKFNWHDIEAKNKVVFKDDDADHLGLVLEPHISKWAEKLNDHLQKDKRS